MRREDIEWGLKGGKWGALQRRTWHRV